MEGCDVTIAGSLSPNGSRCAGGGTFGDGPGDSTVIGDDGEAASMGPMQPTASTTSNRFERRLDGLREHPILGRPVRFYFRRREQVLYLVVGETHVSGWARSAANGE